MTVPSGNLSYWSRQQTFWQSVFGGRKSIREITVIFICTFCFLNVTNVLDTQRSSFFQIRVAGLNLLPDEWLIVLAAVILFFRWDRLFSLAGYPVFLFLLTLFIMASSWSILAMLSSDIDKQLIRSHVTWILAPIGLCISLRSFKESLRLFYITILFGVLGAASFYAMVILGVQGFAQIFPNMDPVRFRIDGGNHFGFMVQTELFLNMVIPFVLIMALTAQGLRKRNFWLAALIIFLGVPILALSRGHLIQEVVFNLVALIFFSPTLGIKLGKRFKNIVWLLLVPIIIISFSQAIGLKGLNEAFIERHEQGIEEIVAQKGSFAAHYLAPLEVLQRYGQKGLALLMLGTGPPKTVMEAELTADTRSDSNVYTLIYWYGILGWALSVVLSLLSIKIFLTGEPGKFVPFRYVGLVLSLFTLLDGIPILSGNVLRPNNLVFIWALFWAMHLRQSAHVAIYNRSRRFTPANRGQRWSIP